MKVNVILTEEEKTTINNTINIIIEYRKHATESGAEYIQTLETVNHLTEFLNKAIKTK